MKKSTNWLKSFASGIFTTLAVLALLAVTAGLLMVIATGSTPKTRQFSGTNLGTVERFYLNADNAIHDAMPDVVKTQKKYKITGDTEIPPQPNRDCYGHADSPAELSGVIAAAQKLLDGQTLYFSSFSEVYDKYGVEYYLDDTILAITWKQVISGTMYTFSEVKIADASQFRRYLAGGEYASGKLVYATEMANTVHAVVASSGDYFGYRSAGTVVYNGSVCRVNNTADTCYIDKNGDMLFSHIYSPMDQASVERFVEENDIRFSLAFGPILVENGQPNSFGGYPLGEVSDQNARAAICQMGKLHYLLVNACGEDGHALPNMYQFARQVAETGCINAYALDGGQTTALVMDNTLVNRVLLNYQRKITDIIYFATAIPNS